MKTTGSLLISKLPSSLIILSQIYLVHASPCHELKIHLILTSYVGLDLPSGLYPSGLTTKTIFTRLIPP
jgi:hypothetical protein